MICTVIDSRKSGPISRVLSRPYFHKDGMTIPLGYALRRTSSNLPGNLLPPKRKTGRTVLAAALFGLAPDGVCPATRLTTDAVSSYLAVSPLPFDSAFRPRSGRFVFCGTFRPVTGPGR